MGAIHTLAESVNVMMAVAKAIEDDVNDFVKDVASAVTYEVVYRTPVDVGTARSNWHTRLASPTALIYKAAAPYPSRHASLRSGKRGRGGTRSETANLNAAVTQGKAALTRRKVDVDIYISNNLPYIVPLNKGHSPQSGAGFIRGGISAGVSKAVGRFKFTNLNRTI